MSKKNLNEFLDDQLHEMATVGSFPIRKTKYSIYPEPLGNPSFHISTVDFEVVLTIRDFRILEWKRGESKVKGKIPSADFKRFLKWAESETDGINNWIYLLRTWNENNPQFRIAMNTPLSNRILYEDREKANEWD